MAAGEYFVGEGSFGRVWRRCTTCQAQNAHCASCVAVKRIPHPDIHPDHVAELEKEAQVLQSVCNAVPSCHVVRFCHYEHNELVTEYVPPLEWDGKRITSLEDMMDFCTEGEGEGAVAVEAGTLYDILVQIVGTLAQLQRAFPGFRHGDLHPGNILLTAWPAHLARTRFEYGVEARGRILVKIIDFGHAGVWGGKDTRLSADDPCAVALACPLFDVYRLALFLMKSICARERPPPPWAAVRLLCVHVFGGCIALGRVAEDEEPFTETSTGGLWPSKWLCAIFAHSVKDVPPQKLLRADYFK